MEVITIKDLERTILKDDLEMLVENVNENIGNKATLGEIKHYIVDEETTAREEADNKLKTYLTETAKELDNKKITKFYASSLGNTNLPDSDNGKPTDMIIYGKSVQDGTPTPENPIEIQSVVNPKITVCGKNLFDINLLNANGITVSGNEAIGTLFKFHSNFVNGIKGLKIPKGVITFSASVYTDELSEGTISLSVYFQYTDGSNERLEYKYSETSSTKTRKSLTSDKNKTVSSIGLSYGTGGGIKTTISDIQLEEGLTATDYEPYKGQTASLPYTLNAIPVSEGGNITIDGQQYIADYVDVEEKKHYKYFDNIDLGILNYKLYEVAEGNLFRCNLSDIPNCKKGNSIKKSNAYCEKYICLPSNSRTDLSFAITEMYLDIIDSSYTDKDTFKQSMSGVKLLYELPTPTETDLTDEEIEAFKALETYYPITNVFVTSEQLDGYTVFNYPLNMANGWNYVMEQIGETRPIIYDTEVKVLENSIDTAILTAMMEA